MHLNIQTKCTVCLFLQPEGVAKEYSNPILIDLKNTSSFSKDVALTLPAGVVAGSQRVVVSAIGRLDLLTVYMFSLHV